MADLPMIELALQTFCAPGQVVELRALKHGKGADCEVFGDLAALAARAAEYDASGQYKGLYFTPNPLRPDLVGWKPSSIKAEDIVERRWLLIDCDTIRPVKTNATEEELQAAWVVCDRCRSTLESAGLRGAVIGCSGNGWHLCYPLRLPNDQAAHDQLKAILTGLQERCGDPVTKEEAALVKAGEFLPSPKARVDTSCHDAPRIWKLAGTTARKGPPTADRPHRMAYLAEVPS